MYNNDMNVDQSMISAFKLYFLYGLTPGSCTSYLLAGEYDEAFERAHPMIKGEEMWNDHIAFVETCIPECCRNECFNTWAGYFDAIHNEPELELFITLTYGTGTFIHTWINETEKFRMQAEV